MSELTDKLNQLTDIAYQKMDEGQATRLVLATVFDALSLLGREVTELQPGRPNDIDDLKPPWPLPGERWLVWNSNRESWLHINHDGWTNRFENARRLTRDKARSILDDNPCPIDPQQDLGTILILYPALDLGTHWSFAGDGDWVVVGTPGLGRGHILRHWKSGYVVKFDGGSEELSLWIPIEEAS